MITRFSQLSSQRKAIVITLLLSMLGSLMVFVGEYRMNERAENGLTPEQKQMIKDTVRETLREALAK